MHQVVKGLVIRTVDYKDADRILTVLTQELGRITVRARGVRRKNSNLRAAGQLFAWASMTLFENKGRFTLNEAQLLEQFHGLSQSLERMALASYFAELLGTEAEADRPHPDALRLALNALHALSKGLYGPEKVKAAFELRYMALSGYQPALEACAACGRPAGREGWFEPRLGTVRCAQCGRPPDALPLDAVALEAARYIISAPVGRIFSFHLAEASLALLGAATERYLLECMERGFRTLDFYKGLAP